MTPEPLSPGGGGAKHWFTTTGPSATPARSSIAYAVSISSLTGVSSGSVTSITWQRAGSSSSATTSEACLLIGPDAHRVEQAARREQERDRVARGRRVDDDQVGGAGLVERLDLPEHEDVLHAGNGVGDDLERPRRDQSLGDPLHPVGLEVVDERGVGREEPRADARVELDLVVGERRPVEHRRQARFALDLYDEHARTRARRGHRQRGGHGRLPDAALSRDDDDVGGGAKLRNLHPGMLREQMRSPYVRVCTLAAAVVTLLVVLAASASAAGAQDGDSGTTPRDSGQRGIMVVQVNGLIDPANAALITSSIDEAARRRASLLVFQLDGSGGVDVDSARARAGDPRVAGAGRRVGRTLGWGRAGRERVARARRRRTRRSRRARTSDRSCRSTSTIPCTAVRRATRRRSRHRPAVGQGRARRGSRRRQRADALPVHRRARRTRAAHRERRRAHVDEEDGRASAPTVRCRPTRS